jgi:hypothetical protein
MNATLSLVKRDVVHFLHLFLPRSLPSESIDGAGRHRKEGTA